MYVMVNELPYLYVFSSRYKGLAFNPNPEMLLCQANWEPANPNRNGLLLSVNQLASLATTREDKEVS